MSKGIARFVGGRSARTPLFGTLRRAAGVARLARCPEQPALSELVDMQRDFKWSRRALLKAAAATFLALGGRSAAADDNDIKANAPRRGSAPRIAVIGAGLAGLNAAHILKKAGLRATVYEASNRAGGRIHTARDVLAPGLVSELGGEFIDSDHTDMFALVREFDLELVDLDALHEGGPLRETFFFEGSHRTEVQIAEAFQPLAEWMQGDLDELGENVGFANEGGAGELDRLSITQYLDRIEAAGWLRKLIEVAYTNEFGLDCDRLSALNLLFLISTDDASDKFALYGQSDERFRIKGGNRQIIDALAERLGDQIQYEHRLEAIRSVGDGFRLSMARPGASLVDVEADFVIIAIPFSVLRRVDLRVELPAAKKKAIAEIGYGTNTKILAGVRERVWLGQGYTGSVFSDEPFQSAWENSHLQGSQSGGLTLFAGGKQGLDMGAGTAAEQVRRLVRGVDKVFPGISSVLNGKTERFHWPSYPFAEGSYACYLPGQWTTIAGAEGQPVGNLFFAGEHCSFVSSGYMNGSAESGRRTAKAILARCNRV
jgi:monoamine oxidase